MTHDTVKVYVSHCGECDHIDVDEYRHGRRSVPKELYDRYVVAAKNLSLILDEINQHIKEQ